MASKVIALRGDPIVDEALLAVAAITPGYLIEVASGKWQKHGTAAKNAAAIFALERDELGKEITEDYAINDYVKAGHFAPGMRVNALIASGQNLTIGTYLESAGDGTLRTLTTDSATDDTQRVSVVAMSVEDSGAVVVETRHKVAIV